MAGVAARADSASFKIGPLTTYADTAAMACWLEAAKPGDEMIYATGPMLGDHAAARLARTMAEGGLVELKQRRSGKPNCFDYCAAKLDPGVESNPASSSAAVEQTHLEQQVLRLQLDEARVYQCVATAAQNHAPCPSLARIATICRLESRFRAKYLLGRLVEQGLLTKHERPAGARRDAPTVFTVVLANKTTRGDG